jgi:hypothetical protein
VTELVLTGTGGGWGVFWSSPGRKKSKGEIDLETLMPLHPAPAIAATTQSSSNEKRIRLIATPAIKSILE